MTKKPSEKNKAWEKDRRDRLNKTFDELAKLLPKFDKSVAWSKIEIIQKAIAFIENLHKRLEDYLTAKDPELLKEYKEFINCLRFYQERNAQLTELLKKAKVTLPPPPVELPQLLVNKPELLPNQENVQVVQPKPKRQRNRSKKANDVDATKKNEEIKENKESSVDANKASKPEVVSKPTAIITALGREPIDDVSNAPNPTPAPPPPPPPPVPAKPLLLRMRKLRKRHQRQKLVPQAMFRKCYPHPSRMANWDFGSISSRKLSLKQRRQGLPKKRIHLNKSETPSKRLKVDFKSVPLREQSVSPTAAFLLSFPVVTSSMLGGKNVENTDNLENLNNFFTTEEYSKFCDQNSTGKVISPLPAENEGKPSVSEKPMTLFTVSAITRPSAPKNIPEMNGTRSQTMSTAAGFDGCYTFGNGNPMIGSTNMCTAGASSNSQQTMPKGYPATNRVQNSDFSPTIPPPAKLLPKQEQTNPQASEKFFPRYNHSTSVSLRSALETPVQMLNTSLSNRIQKDSTGQTKPNWPSKPEPPRSKSITNQISKPCKIQAPSKTTPYVSPLKNVYDFATQNRNSVADPLISATAAPKIKSNNNSVKSEFPWTPPNNCNQNTLFTPFDLATIVCDSLTSPSFTSSLSQSKSNCEPAVVDAGTKPSSSTRCNQMNLFLPYEESQYTPSFALPQTRSSTDIQSASWKSLDKPKESAADQIFYDCEQSKPQTKSHVNWMTSPTTTDFTSTSTNALPLPPIDFGNQFASGSTNFDLSFVGCRKDSYDDDNQFINWSPTKPLSADFSTAYSFENFGSNEAPPNKTVKQIFSVSQLVDQTPSAQDITSPMKKKVSSEKPTAATKQSFSNIYSAESLIAKKDNSRFYNHNESVTSSQAEYHNSNSYFFSYPNALNCSENDYLGAGTYQSSQQTVKPNSIQLNPSAIGVGGGVGTFDSTAAATNYFPHTISSNNNDPYDPTYFPSSNYNQSWNHGAVVSGKASGSLNIYNQGQFGASASLQETPSCQQNSNVSGNLTNFNLSSICPEIDGKNGPSEW